MGVLGINHVAFRSRAPDALHRFYLELERGPVEHTPWSRGIYARDPDGRRLEFTYDDRSVYWR